MVESLDKKYPEAYQLMMGFYTSKFFNSDPDCRPADNVLMAIQYALEHRNQRGNAIPIKDVGRLRSMLEDATWCKRPSQPDVPENWRLSIHDNQELADVLLNLLPSMLSDTTTNVRKVVADVRTTLEILRTQIMVEINRGHYQWSGVPEKLKEQIDTLDQAL